MGVSSRKAAQPSYLTRARRPKRRWLRFTVLAVVSLLAVSVLGSYVFARRSLPQIAGELRLTGLLAPVTVYRDERGVPHIEAANSHDLYMAQGFVTAQDRLWQMDLSRRAASGRLAEVLGASMLDTDKFFRTLNLRPAAEASVAAYSPWAREALDAYTAGVNAFIAQASSGGRLPPEFTILGYSPEPWSPTDSAIIGKFMAYDLGGNFAAEVYRYQLRHLVGDRLANQLLPVYPSDGITIMKSAGTASPVQAAELPPDDSDIDVSGLVAVAAFPDEFVGSNNWVVSGKLTKSGKPLLADDPHLGLRTPSIWYATHLVLSGEYEQMNVMGVTFPGAPGIIIGHNDKIAWGVTNTGPDVQDLYIERRNPNNPYQFQFENKWEDATVIKDPIKVKGQPDVPFEVVVTRHGPIVSEVTGDKENRPHEALALKWTAHLPTTELEAVLAFGKAMNWSEFRQALRKFQVPTQNFVFASVDGTIAYRPAGIVPVRAKGNGLAPVPGWTGTYEWKEFIPFHQMPEVVNPAEGFIATANNKVVDDGYPFFLSYSWAQPYRASRIAEVLTSKTGLTVDDMRLLQTDYTNLQAKSLLPILLAAMEKAPLEGAEPGALALMKAWDHVDSADQGAPLVFHLWWKHLNQQLYEPKMGKELFKRMADQGNVTDELLRMAAKGQENDWVKEAGGLEKLAAASFKSAVAEAVKLQGKEPSKWAWGKFHRIGPAHPLGGAVKPLGWLLNARAYPVGGSNVTVGAMSFNRDTGMVSSAAPWRTVVDLADITGNSHDIVAPGQSGHFLSHWYTDQAERHVRGELMPQNFTPASYNQGARLILRP